MPSMSVMLITPDTFVTIRQTVRCLAEQTIASQLELMIICDNEAALDVDAGAISGFANVPIVELTRGLNSTAEAHAIAIERATAPVVAFAEDHCFPEPEWAAALVARHAGDWAAVGPVLKSANPESAVSFADLYMGYGPFLHPSTGGPADFLPGHNSSYKRDVLLAYGKRLSELLASEHRLHEQLRGDGHRLYLDGAVVARHTNFSRWKPFLWASYLSARSFAGHRSSGWSVVRRIAFAAAWPLIAAVRYCRIVKQVFESGKGVAHLLWCTPALIGGLVSSAWGEAVGYLFGSGNAQQRLVYYEFHRYRHTLNATTAAYQPALATA